MTNEQKAKRLEYMAAEADAHASRAGNQALRSEPGSKDFARYETHRRRWLADAALLHEAAALMRERDPDDLLWELEYQRQYKRFDLCAWQGLNGKWHWTATRSDLCYRSGEADTLAAVQAAAIDWVDQQEGK